VAYVLSLATRAGRSDGGAACIGGDRMIDLYSAALRDLASCRHSYSAISDFRSTVFSCVE
jgi:hypothetical protein